MSRRAEVEQHSWANRQTRWTKRPAANPLADEDLATSATNAIECLTTIPPEMIRVTACKGWVHLEGTVNWPDQRTTLEQVTRHLPGVQGIVDSITVQPLWTCHLQHPA